MYRRKILRAVGIGAAASLAGCSSSGEEGESTADQDGSLETDQSTATTGATGPEASPLTWYSANRDSGDSRYAPDQTFDATEYGINWSSGTGGASERILSDGERLYFQGDDVIYAMDAAGNKLWSRSETSYSDMAYHDGKLLTVTGSTILIVNAETGERITVLPDLPVDTAQNTSQTTATGLYIRSTVSTFAVVDIAAEEVLFEKKYDEMEEMPYQFSPPYDIAANDDVIYFSGDGDDDNYLVKINGRSGEIVGDHVLEGLTKEPKKTVTQGETIATIAAGFDNTPDVIAYDTEGTVHWHKENVVDLSPYDFERASLAIDETNVYYLTLQSVFAFDRTSGEQKWRYNTTSTLPHNVLSTGDELLIPDDTTIHRIDANSGEAERLDINVNGFSVQIRPATTGLYVFADETHHIVDDETV